MRPDEAKGESFGGVHRLALIEGQKEKYKGRKRKKMINMKRRFTTENIIGIIIEAFGVCLLIADFVLTTFGEEKPNLALIVFGVILFIIGLMLSHLPQE